MTWLQKWGQLLRSTPEGIESAGAAQNTNLGAVEDAEPAAESVPLNTEPSNIGSILQIRTARDK